MHSEDARARDNWGAAIRGGRRGNWRQSEGVCPVDWTRDWLREAISVAPDPLRGVSSMATSGLAESMPKRRGGGDEEESRGASLGVEGERLEVPKESVTQFPDAESSLPARTSNDKKDGDKVPVALRMGKGTTKCGRFEVQRRHAAKKRGEEGSPRLRRREGGENIFRKFSALSPGPAQLKYARHAQSTQSSTVLIGGASSALAL